MRIEQIGQTVGQELAKHIAVLEEIVAAIKLQEEVLVSQSNAIREIGENMK
jgi:hypothetical protein